ncbi:DUF4097 family beta strand repeat-containing protein [Paenibacillus nasutitermitis]|uniref:DUF4097 domain-containing protein n=1 Tax=Paenibacillus nasutitermitis TaxID=1652958 RepID=A0A917DQZ9_9BACL|nr:DUF4097 family beta strand repeat-containing protein [Paenibacillus nasutitermitis]GGD58367.1 hypothetical protein GCM10010911_15200 [Paenibacillus nasutitermitis]
MKKIIGALLLMGGLVLMGLSFPQLPQTWKGQEQRFAIPDTVQTISVSASQADIRITSVDDLDEIKVTLSGNGSLNVNHSEERIDLQVEDKSWGLLPRGCTLDIYLPSFYKQVLMAEADEGNIDVYGGSEEGRMTLRELALTIHLGNVKVMDTHAERLLFNGAAAKFSGEQVEAGSSEFELISGKIDLDKYSGDYDISMETGKLNVSNFSNGDGRVKLTAGQINLDHYEGGLKAEITSGEINAQLDRAGGAFDIHIISGNVNFLLPLPADFRLDAATEDGRIRAVYPFDTIDTQERRKLEAASGTGKIPLRVRLLSGNLNVDSTP